MCCDCSVHAHGNLRPPQSARVVGVRWDAFFAAALRFVRSQYFVLIRTPVPDRPLLFSEIIVSLALMAFPSILSFLLSWILPCIPPLALGLFFSAA